MSNKEENKKRFIYGYFELNKLGLDIEVARAYYKIDTQEGKIELFQKTRLADGGYGLIDHPFLEGNDLKKAIAYFENVPKREEARKVIQKTNELEKEVGKIGHNGLF